MHTYVSVLGPRQGHARTSPPVLTATPVRAAVRPAARDAAAASAAEAGLGGGKTREMCLVVHPDHGISCATRLPLEHALTRTASLASAWSAKLSRPSSGKLEGELIYKHAG